MSHVLEKVAPAVRSRVQENLHEQIALTRDLVRIPSVTGTEGPAQEFMVRCYRNAGLTTCEAPVDFSAVNQHPEYCGLRETAEAYEGRPNVVATLRGTGGGPSLVLGGHIDVVSAEPEGSWEHDPWGAEIVGDRMYGRGANDMKAGLIANLMAVRALTEAGVDLPGDIILQSTIEEEAGGGGGTLALFVEGSIGDGVLISEPTQLGLRIGSGGVLYFRITVAGRTAHAGNAHLGVNAIHHLIHVYAALEALDEIRAKTRAPLFEKGSYGRSCHLNLGILKAGDWPSTVPGQAVLEGRLGFLPGETCEDVQKQLEDAVQGAARGNPWLEEHPPTVEYFGFRAAPWLEPTNSPIIDTALQATAVALGKPAELHARASAVDNRFAQSFNKPSLCLGTRGQGNHGADEFVELSSLAPLTLALALTAVQWCSPVTS